MRTNIGIRSKSKERKIVRLVDINVHDLSFEDRVV
jgi:hypothetical protein